MTYIDFTIANRASRIPRPTVTLSRARVVPLDAVRYVCKRCSIILGRFNEAPTGPCLCGCTESTPLPR